MLHTFRSGCSDVQGVEGLAMDMLFFVILDIMTKPFFTGFWAVFVFYAAIGLAGYLAKWKG